MSSNAPELSTWLSWKRNCALDLCTAEEQSQLASFIGPILIKHWEKHSRGVSILNFSPDDRRSPLHTAFHYFETYMHSTSGATGKRWKDWLFARAEGRWQDQPYEEALKANVIQILGNAVLVSMMKGEVYWKPDLRKSVDGAKKSAAAVFVSFDDPHKEEEQSWKVQDFLPAATHSRPDNEAALNELQIEGNSFAEKYFEKIDFVTRVALLAATLGISLSESVVEHAVGKKKSVLYGRLELSKEKQLQFIPAPGRRFSALWLEIRSELAKQWPREEKITLDLLTDFSLEALSEVNFRWAESEKRCEPLFSLMSSTS
jgi:hypothetical protein